MQHYYFCNHTWHTIIYKIKSKMSFLSLRFGQFCDFRPKDCFSAYGSKRFEIFAIFIWLVNSIHFSPLSQGYFCLFC
ncbi:hypothetical protein Hanom_Chr00s019041g01758731 [Helianthus anomalus]